MGHDGGRAVPHGGKGETNGYGVDKNGQVGIIRYRGLSEQEAREAKQAAIDAWREAKAALEEVVKRQDKELQDAGKKPEDWRKIPR